MKFDGTAPVSQIQFPVAEYIGNYEIRRRHVFQILKTLEGGKSEELLRIAQFAGDRIPTRLQL